MRKKLLTTFLVMFMGVLLLTVSGFAKRGPDLVIKIRCPHSAMAGQELGTSIEVFVKNRGDVTAKDFNVDLVLSTDTTIPVQFATYSPNFSEDVLLQGGREKIDVLKPGQTKKVTLYGNNKIPDDTPSGLYYLGAVADPGKVVTEFNEQNNTNYCRMKIKGKMVLRPVTPAITAIRPQLKLPDLGMYGFLKLGKFKKEVKWGKTITLTPADATLISNGKPAFEVYYSHREYNGVAASGFKNKVYFNGNVVSIQSSLSLAPMQIDDIHTQAYLGPMNGKLEIHIDDEDDVKEAREDNNFHFFVYINFKGFDTTGQQPQQLPDLIVKDLELVQDCKIKVTIANIGSAGVPASGYDLNNGAAIQMYRFAQPWGGIRLGAIDPSHLLMTPGNSVSWIWFPGAANLNLTPGTHSIKVVVDNNNAVVESDETNNSRTERLTCEQSGGGETPGEPCGIRLDKLSTNQGHPGDVFEMYGVWGATQGIKLPCINRGGMNKLIVLSWSNTTLKVKIPAGLAPGKYRVGVYCNDPALGTTYSSGWKDFYVVR
jgi:hypothetical protein